ncbi:hypothetical protein Tco_0084824 [Tanacetum coccineum]
MTEQQTITYAPQWNNMTVDDVVFQTNNVVGNFNYPPNVHAYKPIMKFLRNCPLYQAFTNCPSVVYQNFLREFWCTAIAYDPFPSTDEPEKCPFKEFLIKFLVSNGQRTLTLDFKTFCSITSLDYNNGKYVDHPTPEVLGRNYSSTKQVNSIKQLLAYSLIIGTKGTATHPKDSGGNKQPLDRDITSTAPNEGTAKTTPRLEGSLGDNESEGNIPPTDMKPIHTTVTDPLGKTSSKVEPDTEPLQLQTYADIQAFLLADDEIDKESDEEKVLVAGDDMDTDT